MKSSLTVSCLFILLAVHNLPAQVTSLDIDPFLSHSARASAMGQMYSSDRRDAGSLYWNPACLGSIGSFTTVLTLTAARIQNDDILTSANACASIPLNGSLGIGFGVGSFSILEPDASWHPRLSSMNISGVDIGIGGLVGRRLAIGVGTAVRVRTQDDDQAFGGTFSAGVLYNASNATSYGLSVNGVGVGFSALPIGLSADSILRVSNLPGSISFSITKEFPGNSLRKTVCIMLGSQKRFGTDDLIYKAGAELRPSRVIAVRLGYWLGPSSVAAKAGFGLLLGPLAIDYALSWNRTEPRYHQVSIAILS